MEAREEARLEKPGPNQRIGEEDSRRSGRPDIKKAQAGESDVGPALRGRYRPLGF